MGNLRALALALILVPSVAAAQSAKDKQRASDKVKQAIAKSQAGDHEAAVELYLEAYKIIPQPLLLSNIGSEYQQMKKPVEALSYFCKYIDADPTGNNISYATAQAKTLYIELGGVDDVDDDDVCKPIVKKKKAPDRQPDVGGNTNGNNDNRVDGRTPPPPGQVDAKPASPSSPVRWVGVGLGVVGAGVFGLGTYYGLQAKKISDDITNHDPSQPWPANINQLEADGAAYEKKQIYFMIGGGAALATGIVLYFVGGPKASSESATGVSFTPVATPDTLGFAASGRF
jgi:tetratricopeptide (TPR) repeat protein